MNLFVNRYKTFLSISVIGLGVLMNSCQDAQLPGKTYMAMSANEQSQFINSAADRILNRFGRTPGDDVSNEGLKKIKSFVDNYTERTSDDGKKTGGGESLDKVLKRGSQFGPVIRKAFEANGLQPEIGIYIAMIESEFRPCIQSPTGPLGMFSFTRAKGGTYGLVTRRYATPQNPDERCVPKLASRAAAAYIKKLIDKDFSNDATGILLSIAAFNAGERVLKANIGKTLESAEQKQVITFWTLMKNKEKLSGQFQSENVNYVPMFFAAAIIGENPQVFGIKEIKRLSEGNWTSKEKN